MSSGHPTDTARQLELAWAAGFFDGEGTTGLMESRRGKNHYVYVRLTVDQVELQPLARLQGIIGGRIHGPRERKGNCKPIHTLAVTGQGVKDALDAMWPYLSEPKKRQAERALSLGRIGGGRGSNYSRRDCCSQGHPFSGDNLYVRNGGRGCRACRRLSYHRCKAKAKGDSQPDP